MDPVGVGAAIAGALIGPLGQLIAQEIADGQKSDVEATRAALTRLASEEHLEPVLPKIHALIAEARKPAGERDAG